MRIFSHPRFLPIYSGVLTVTLAVVLLTGAAQSQRQASFEEIDVQRINVREPDGTLRMTISNNARFPGLFDHGREYPHPDRRNDMTAGVLFLDGDGSETGGLTFGGSRKSDGSNSRFGHLSFDQYQQDQVINIENGDENGTHYAGIGIIDRPEWPLSDLFVLKHNIELLPPDERAKAIENFAASRDHSAKRAYLGRREDRSSVLELRDADDRVRILMRVAADGRAALQFLDDKGAVIDQWPHVATTVAPPASAPAPAPAPAPAVAPAVVPTPVAPRPPAAAVAPLVPVAPAAPVTPAAPAVAAPATAPAVPAALPQPPAR